VFYAKSLRVPEHILLRLFFFIYASDFSYCSAKEVRKITLNIVNMEKYYFIDKNAECNTNKWYYMKNIFLNHLLFQ